MHTLGAWADLVWDAGMMWTNVRYYSGKLQFRALRSGW